MKDMTKKIVKDQGSIWALGKWLETRRTKTKLYWYSEVKIGWDRWHHICREKS